MRKLHKGFTLFEILLAMLLMAIIAVSILPGITKNAEQQLFVTQLKKVQNDLKQAMLIISAKNRNSLANVFNNPVYHESNPMWPTGSHSQLFPTKNNQERNLRFAYAIRSALDAHCVYYANAGTFGEKETGNKTTNPKEQAEIFANRNPHFMTGKDKNNQLYSGDKDSHTNNWPQPDNFAALNLKTGATVRPIITDTNCRGDIVCGALEVDLNGAKRPNVVGKDIHFFWIVNNDDGIVPWGENDIYDIASNVQKVSKDNLSTEINAAPTCTLNGKKFNNIQSTLGCTYNILRDSKITYY